MTDEELEELATDVLLDVWQEEEMSEEEVKEFFVWFPDWSVKDFIVEENEEEEIEEPVKESSFKVLPDGQLKITWTADIMVPTQTKKNPTKGRSAMADNVEPIMPDSSKIRITGQSFSEEMDYSEISWEATSFTSRELLI